MMRIAFNYLKNGRPVPVMLVILTDVAVEESNNIDFSYHGIKRLRTKGDPSDIEVAARELISVKNPVMAGSGVLYAEAWGKLLELSELLHIHVFTTMNGKSCFPESHPLSLGCGGRSRPDTVTHFLTNADLIFAIGSSCTKDEYNTHLPEGTKITQSTIGERDIGKDYKTDRAIIGDAKLVLRQLIEQIKKKKIIR